MRAMAMFGFAAAAFMLAAAPVDAARWCHSGAKGCAYRTQAQCLRTARRAGGGCRLQRAARTGARYDVAPSGPVARGGGYSPAPASSSRPLGASPTECYFDEGYGRFTPCSTGGHN